MGFKFDRRGFTLVELLIVISIASILLMLPIINHTNIINNMAFDIAVRELLSDLRYAQMKSILDAKPYKVEFSTSKKYLVREEKKPFFVTIKEVILPPGVELSYNRTNRQCLFNIDGTETNSGGTITITNSRGGSRQITILPVTGRIAIVK